MGIRRLAWLLLTGMGAATAQTAPPLDIYVDGLNPAFQDWSWAAPADYSLTNTTPTHAGNRSIRFLPRNWAGLLFADPANIYDAAQYESLTLWVHGGSAGGQSLQLALINGTTTLAAVDLAAYASGGIVAATWHQVTIPFDASTGLISGSFNRIHVMDFTGATQSVLYLDDVRVNPRTTAPPAGSQSVTINLTQNRRAVSPLVFGVSYGASATLSAVRYPVRRWGGNSTTRYNWQADVHSTAGDYYWQNIPDTFNGSGNPPAGNSADDFIDETRANGGEAMMSIPTIGLTPIDDRVNKRWGFSISKYGPQLRDECDEPGSAGWCTADAGNGECDPAVNTRLDPQGQRYCVYYRTDSNGIAHYHIVNNDRSDTSIDVTPTFWVPWIAHLQSRYGTAAAGGVRLYALDNEPMLWNSTHRDVHPAAPTYDEIWTRGRDIAIRIKQQDPAALVFGPVTWGYPDLFTSAADAENCNCLSGNDRAAHGGKPFVQWYLEQVCAYQQQNGVRLVDYLDLHYYPQGDGVIDFGSNNLGYSESPAVAVRRLRSLRELYDPSFVSESWIGTLGDTDAFHYNKPGLLPRVKAWIAQACPGTKLAITEYNWGPDQGATGALAQAEALAIFAREGVDAAMRWVAPTPGSYAEDAYKLYLNYDGAFARVQGDSVQTLASDVDALGAYAIHQAGQKIFLLLFNKSTSPQDVALTVSASLNGTWNAYRFDGAHHLAAVGSGMVNGTTLQLPAIPARSATLVVLPDSALADRIFANGFQ